MQRPPFLLLCVLLGCLLLPHNLRSQTPEPEIEIYNATTGAVILPFGSVSLGAPQLSAGSVTQGFIVKNTGTAALTGLDASLSQALQGEFEFYEFLAVRSLEPGDEALFSVRFNPSQTGLRTASLRINSNDATENPTTVTISANCVHRVLTLQEGVANTVIPKLGTLDFGAVTSGTNLQKTLVLKNTGLTALHVTSAEFLDDPLSRFTPVSTLQQTSIQPGASYNWPLVFKAYGHGSRSATLRIHSNDSANSPYQITLTGTSIEGKLAVDQPFGTSMSNGQARDFGTVPRLASASLIFTLRNEGSAPLAIQASRTGSPQFAITQAPATPIAVGTSTNVTVTYTPQTGGGPHQASLNITHDGVSPRTFVIPLTGSGSVSMIGMESTHVHVDQGATAVPITLSRTNTSLPAIVHLSTYQDSTALAGQPFQSAVAGLDYVAHDGTEIYFAVGQATQAVHVHLLPRTAMAKKNLQFNVLLENPGTATDITAASSLTIVRILGQDSTKPTLTLTTPAAGKVGGVSPYLLTGKATDASGIRRVEVRLNGGDPVVFAPSGKPIATTVPFEVPIAPIEGANTVEVTAFDMQENAATITRSFTFARRYKLDIGLVDRSGQAYDTATLAITATPAADATPFVLQQPEVPLRSSAVVAGTRVKIVATPAKNHAVFLWLGVPNDTIPSPWQTYLDATGNVYEFTMPAEDTHVRICLTTTPFLPPDGSNKTLYWRLPPTPNVPSEAGSYASLSGTITPAGSFTGKLLIQGRSIPVVARLNGHASAVFNVGSSLRYSLPVPGGELRMGKFEGSEITATLDLQGGGDPQWIPGRWGTYSAANKVNQRLLDPFKTQGYYTLHLTPTETGPRPTDRPYPQGSGYATITLTNLGQATLTGTLADGATFTASAPLVAGFAGQEADVAPFFVQLPTPGATTKTAVLTGDIEFDPFEPYTPHLRGSMRWLRPATTNPKVLLYPLGWPLGFDLSVHGTRYPSSYDLQGMLGGTTPGAGSAYLRFTGGGLTSSIFKSNFALSKNTIKFAPVDASYTLSIAPATGLFSGSFTPGWPLPAAARPAFKGIIVQNARRGTTSARGFFLNNAKTPPVDRDGSGDVRLAPSNETSGN